ncbi:hypothetical protein TanjilG_26310 [Lupinus angustifolius]|uniref:glycerophosphodiester phosphodiesterase n=1 Tax=Lupinus angustifolius TaxID=3871 RepID=A0A4P1R2P1_LUPAN|nr:hypothetical protein TanjilG_26310 [Lupinus angustifolius]
MASSTSFAPLIFVLLIIGCTARPLYNGNRKPLQTFRPYNIAHRGSNGEFPEETAPAYMRAIEEGADFIESDILSSKDVDFTLKELKSLRVKQRYNFRDQQYNGKFQIITFEEFISIALKAPRIVGIYPEIKNPVLINQYVKWADGKRFEDKIMETLKKYGYKGSYLSKDWLEQPAFIQSFAPTSLVYISNLTDLPKILLIDDITIPTQDTNQSYGEITSDSYFDYIKDYVVGIGPWKDTVVPVVNNYLQTPTDLLDRARAHNLQVHPYTYRNENQFLSLNFNQDPYEEYDYWFNKIGVDGMFTDFTGSLHRYQEWTSSNCHNTSDEKTASKLLHKIASLVTSYKG